MKGKILKKLNENTPDLVKRILSKPIRMKVINNNIFQNCIRELELVEKLDEKEIDRIHLERVKETLVYAYENTIYYARVFNEVGFDPYKFENLYELEKIPTINKQVILENFEDIVSKEEIDHYVAYTGGSTGKPLKILLDTDSIYKEKAFVYNYWAKYGYDYKSSRIITLRGL